MIDGHQALLFLEQIDKALNNMDQHELNEVVDELERVLEIAQQRADDMADGEEVAA